MKNKKLFIISITLITLITFSLLIYLIASFLKVDKNVADKEIGKTINIGVVNFFGADLKKYAPVAGHGAYIGAMAHLNKINNSNGIFNRKINFIIKDDRSMNPLETSKSAEQLMQEHDIFAFMWPQCTQQTKAMQDLLSNTGIPLLFPISSNLNPHTKGIYYIRPTFQDEYESKIKNFIRGIDDNENASIATEREEVCHLNRMLFLKAAKHLNKKVNPGFYYNPIHHQFSGSVNQPEYAELKNNILEFKKNNVKTVVLLSTLTGAYFLRVAEKLNFHPRYISPSVLYADFVIPTFFPKVNNFYATAAFPIPSVSRELKIIQEFERDMKDSGYNEPYSIIMLEGYLGAKVLVDTLKKVGPNLTRKKFVEALESTKNLDYGGISFSFSSTSNVGNHKVYFYKYTSGKPELVNF